MKKSLTMLFCGVVLGLGARFAVIPLNAVAAPSQPTPATGATAATNAPAPIPQSLFAMPQAPKDGRDPFFPSSSRVYANPLVKTNKGPVQTARLFLHGLSGSMSHRLCMINNGTFAEGEEGEVMTTEGKVRIRCIKIKEDSVLVEASGERQELRLRQGL